MKTNRPLPRSRPKTHSLNLLINSHRLSPKSLPTTRSTSRPTKKAVHRATAAAQAVHRVAAQAAQAVHHLATILIRRARKRAKSLGSLRSLRGPGIPGRLKSALKNSLRSTLRLPLSLALTMNRTSTTSTPWLSSMLKLTTRMTLRALPAHQALHLARPVIPQKALKANHLRLAQRPARLRSTPRAKMSTTTRWTWLRSTLKSRLRATLSLKAPALLAAHLAALQALTANPKQAGNRAQSARLRSPPKSTMSTTWLRSTLISRLRLHCRPPRRKPETYSTASWPRSASRTPNNS